MSILIFLLKALLIIYGFSAFIGCIRFLIDVRKWHNQEKKVEITASAERGEDNGRTDNNNDRGTGDTRTGDGDNNDSSGDSDGDNNNSDRYDW